MKSVYGSAIRGARNYQEDAFAVDEQDPERPNSDVLITLCDGMGGHIGGRIASDTALKAFKTNFLKSSETDAKQRLGKALDMANQAVAAKIAGDQELESMGCTLVGVIKLHNRLVWISVGDSHIYRYRAGKLEKLNQDHSFFGELKEMVKRGEITEQEAISNPKRNALRSAVHGKHIPLIDINSSPLEEGDLLLIASDGIDTLSHEDLRQEIERRYGQSPEDVVHNLLDAVANVQKPNQDNTTIVACYHTAHEAGFWSDTTIWEPSRDAPATKSQTPLIVGLTVALVAALVVLMVVLSQPEPEPVPEPLPLPPAQPTEIEDGGITDDEDLPGSEDEIPQDDPPVDDGTDSDGDTDSDGADADSTDGGEIAPDDGADGAEETPEETPEAPAEDTSEEPADDADTTEN